MVKGVTVERAQTYDLIIGRGMYLGQHDDYLPKGTVRDLTNYRPLTSIHEKILDPRIYTTAVMDAAATPLPILSMMHFETLAGVGYVFGVSTRRILSFDVTTKLFGVPNGLGDFTSIYNDAAYTLTVPAAGVNATITGADCDGMLGLNPWPIKAGDLIEDPLVAGSWLTIATVGATVAGVCAITVAAGTPFTGAFGPLAFTGVRRLLTSRTTDTVTFCFFNHLGTARIVMTNGGGAGAATGPDTTYDPILYWEPTMATFQPLPGVNNLRGYTYDATHLVTAMTAEIVVAYKDMLLAINLRERQLTDAGALNVWGAWASAPQRIRNTGIGSSTEWNLVGGVGYASWLDRPDTAGPIESAIVWRDNVFIGKRDELEILSFTGSTYPVFIVTKLLHDEGCQFRHGLCNLREDIVMLGNRDIYLMAETMPRKIGTNITAEMFAELDDNNRKQTFVCRWKGKNEIWIFYRSKGSALQSTILGCDRAMVWNYEHDTWTKVDVVDTTHGYGFTYCGAIPYLRAAIPWSALDTMTWADLGALTWADLVREVIETPLMGTQTGVLVNYEGGQVVMPGGVNPDLVKWRERDGLLETGLQDLGLPDCYKRLLGVFVEFQNKHEAYQYRVLSSSKKTDRLQMEADTGWLNEADQVDITAKYFIIMVRQADGEDSNPSEMAQIRLKYYPRGQR